MKQMDVNAKKMDAGNGFEPELDKVFEVDGKRYRCIKGDGEPCFSCSLFLKDCHGIVCSELERKDRQDVIFVEENEGGLDNGYPQSD